MKKIFPIVLCAFFMISCSSSRKGIDGGQQYKVIGFVKQDVFRVEAMGIAKAGVDNVIIRKQLAKNAAMSMAEFGVLEYFVERGEGNKYKNLEGAKNDEGIVKGWLKGGEVISSKYDDDQTCKIVYEVKLIPKRR